MYALLNCQCLCANQINSIVVILLMQLLLANKIVAIFTRNSYEFGLDRGSFLEVLLIIIYIVVVIIISFEFCFLQFSRKSPLPATQGKKRLSQSSMHFICNSYHYYFVLFFLSFLKIFHYFV